MVGGAVGQDGHALKTRALPEYIGGISRHRPAEGREVAHQVAHAGAQARACSVDEHVDGLTGELPVVQARQLGPGIAGIALERLQRVFEAALPVPGKKTHYPLPPSAA